MSKIDDPPEATFRILIQKDERYGVEISIPDTFPTTVTSFATEADAEAWIEGYKLQLQNRGTNKRWRRRPAASG